MPHPLPGLGYHWHYKNSYRTVVSIIKWPFTGEPFILFRKGRSKWVIGLRVEEFWDRVYKDEKQYYMYRKGQIEFPFGDDDDKK